MINRLFFVVLLMATLTALSSCGESDPGSSVALFQTVKVTASVTPNPYRIKIGSGTTCTNGVISGSSVTTVGDATVAYTSTGYPGITGQSVSLKTYKVTFATGTAGAPPITTIIYGVVSQPLLPGGTISASIPLTNASILNTLTADPNLESCALTEYTYYATITTIGTEEGGTNRDITTTVPVIVSNY